MQEFWGYVTRDGVIRIQKYDEDDEELELEMEKKRRSKHTVYFFEAFDAIDHDEACDLASQEYYLYGDDREGYL